jgi:hypothetical protein
VKKWTCPGCGRNRTSTYCPACGEEPLRDRDLSVADLAAQLGRTVSDLDGKLVRTLRALLTRPGSLSEAHVLGIRRPYVGPFKLFLLANALFFAIQSLTHINVLSSTLHSHLHEQDWSPTAQALVAARLEEKGRTLAAYAPTFDHAVLFNAKTLIILMALLFLPFLPVVFHRARRTVGAHFVFALHLYAFILVLMCVSLLIAEADLLAGGEGLASHSVDLALSLFNIACVAIYLYFSTGAFYGARGPVRVAGAAGLAFATGAILVLYRFLIFLVTLYTS